MTPSARTTQWLKKRGWIACRVEQRLHMPKSPYPITRDAFGFGDVLAAFPSQDEGIIALIQVTSGDHVAHRRAKIIDECSEAAKAWMQAGGKIFIHGWRKGGPRGKGKTWTLREVELDANLDVINKEP